MYHCLSSYYSVFSQLLYQEAYKVSLLCHPPPQIQFVNITLKLQMNMKKTSVRESQRLHMYLDWVESSTPLFKNVMFVLNRNALTVKNVYVCVHIHTHVCICMYICIFLRKGEKKVTTAIMHKKRWLLRVTWVFLPEQQSSAVWELTELPQWL